MILSLFRRGQNNWTNWTGRFQSMRRSRLIHCECSYGKGRCFSSFRVQWRKNWKVSWSLGIMESEYVGHHSFFAFLAVQLQVATNHLLSGWVGGSRVKKGLDVTIEMSSSLKIELFFPRLKETIQCWWCDPYIGLSRRERSFLIHRSVFEEKLQCVIDWAFLFG